MPHLIAVHQLDPVLGVRRKAGQAQGARGDLVRGRSLAGKDDKLRAALLQMLLGKNGRVGTVEAQNIRAVHPTPIGFPPSGHVGQHARLVVRQLARVHFEPHMPLRRDPGAEPNIQRPARGMAGARPHMAAGHGHRQKQRRIVLNAQALNSIVAVAQPHPLRPLHDAEIDATAARGTAFNLHMGKLAAQPVEQRIRPPRLRRIRHRQNAVMIPFDIVDVMAAEDVADPGKEERLHRRQRHIQRHLLAAHDLILAPQCPIGMSAENIRIRIDHLRLEPDAEGHAEAFDVIDQRRQTIGIFARINLPIA
mmetsp:Transcript_23678/g.42208  ORF Transcript_23678/g.42208 Transcript_23678/m.42208 type:complete len:307 (-) Transcript_23678:394-1314(-)